MERSSRALLAALFRYGWAPAWHLVVILPFALLLMLVEWQRQIRLRQPAVIGFGVFRLFNRRHPRALAGSRRRNWRSGPSLSRSPMAPD